ncbi:MAG: alpha/beta fold hydrolase [Candidatus Viridilinea halotolerans]|uniref:Alpha/beta fold hydrolase n=1 Tax=Candidatus Viridilinea halotolerans TaxID=2491704 RepID=A0A426U9G5_9CHLR|nr:MAG: alpha/beta fold hydrolase [Candidatus Viridilinea halotolerans]
MSNQDEETIEVDERMITVADGVRLRVLMAGDGPAVLLLHGFAVNADDWLQTVAHLASIGFRAIAPDALGFGQSDKPGGAAYSLQRYAALNVALLDALGIARASIVGHSMGGKMALATTILYPERVERLVIADSEGFMQIPLFMRKGGSLPFLGEAILALTAQPVLIRMQLHAAFANPQRYITPALIERGRKTLADPGVRNTMLALSRHFAANDLQGAGLFTQLSSIQQPTLIVWGAEDRMFPPKYARAAQAALPHAQLVVIPNCGHFPMIEAEAEFHQLLEEFLG